MILWVFGFSDAEARKSSIISLNSGDLFRYFDFHLAQSVPAGALFASSTKSIRLFSQSACFIEDQRPQDVVCKPQKRTRRKECSESVLS